LHREQQCGAVRVRFTHDQEHGRNTTARLPRWADCYGCSIESGDRACLAGPNTGPAKTQSGTVGIARITEIIASRGLP
jgi:hypothetical protein